MLCQRYARNQEEAKDILHDGLLEVFRDLHLYDEKRADFSIWSRRVMAHAAIRYLKKWKRMDSLDSLEDHKSKYFEEIDQGRKIDAETLTKAIQKLPDGYRMVFNLYMLEGFTHKEIAEYLNISEGTSRSQFFKAKKQLQLLLEVIF